MFKKPPTVNKPIMFKNNLQLKKPMFKNDLQLKNPIIMFKNDLQLKKPYNNV